MIFKTILTILALVILTNTSIIIYSPESLLSRSYTYSIQLNFTDKSSFQKFYEFQTVFAINYTCPSKICFYGWINQYKINNQSYYLGFPKTNLQNNALFYLESVSSNTASLLKNPEASKVVSRLIDISCWLFNPSLFQKSNLTSSTNQTDYNFTLINGTQPLWKTDIIHQISQDIVNGSVLETIQMSSNLIIQRRKQQITYTLNDSQNIQKVSLQFLKINDSIFYNTEPFIGYLKNESVRLELSYSSLIYSIDLLQSK